jgi:hypothetical protein
MGDNTGNSVKCGQIMMGFIAPRHVGCPEAKVIEEFGVGDITEITSRRSVSVIYEHSSMRFDVPSLVSRHLIEQDVMWCGRPTPDCN